MLRIADTYFERALLTNERTTLGRNYRSTSALRQTNITNEELPFPLLVELYVKV